MSSFFVWLNVFKLGIVVTEDIQFCLCDFNRLLSLLDSLLCLEGILRDSKSQLFENCIETCSRGV